MPFVYTGDLSKVHSPDLGPAVGRFPIINIPVNGDPNNGSVLEQPLEVLADYIAFLMTQIGPATPPYFGDGSDGPLTVTGGTTTLSGVVKNYTDLTISSTGILVAKRSIIRVNGTLNVNATGLVHDNGAAASGTTAGAGDDGTAPSITTPCPISGGTSGGAGTSTTAGLPGADFAVAGNTLGLARNAELAYVGLSAKGGAGGSGSSGAGGAAGCSASTADDLVSADLLWGSIFTPGFVGRIRYANHGAGDIGSFAELVPLRGGSGGGAGGGDSTASAGAGGAGGGVLVIFANKVILGSTSCVQANGGNGGNAAGTNAGGGGGGGGGRVIIFHAGASGSTLSAGGCVVGGSGGSKTGTGVAGSAGSSGSLSVKQIA